MAGFRPFPAQGGQFVSHDQIDELCDGCHDLRPWALLDINVVIALLDQGHVMHRAASHWLVERELDDGWATCPINEKGAVRIMAQLAYPIHQPAALVAQRLGEVCCHPSHAFWSEPVQLVVNPSDSLGSTAGLSPDYRCLPAGSGTTHGGRFTTTVQRINVDMDPAVGSANLCIVPSGLPPR